MNSDIYREIIDYRCEAEKRGEHPLWINLSEEQQLRLKQWCMEVDASMIPPLNSEHLLTNMVFSNRRIAGMHF